MKQLFQYEHRSQPLATKKHFSSRLARNALWAMGVIILGLMVGMAGYMTFEGMRPIDAFANASMILSGMGQLTALTTDGGKIFASLYAIFSGLLIFGIAGLVLAPVFHRLLHRFHVDEGPKAED